MALKEQILNDIKDAMRSKDTVALTALRAVKSAIMLQETEKNAKAFDEAAETKLLQKLVKQRKESAEIYTRQNRPELAETELKEAEVISRYLPEMISGEKLEAAIAEIIAELNAEGMKDMGKVMGAANKKLAGKADGKEIADIVKKKLA